jgi:hypothetical protein
MGAELTEPAQKPGRSKQDYGTPPDLVRAVNTQWGPIRVDLAAHDNGDNAKADIWIGPFQDSLRIDWVAWLGGGLGWLNPPFGDIEPWAEKCRAESRRGAKILMLTPAAIGTEWFAQYVIGEAQVIGIRPRPIFEVTVAGHMATPQLGLFGQESRELVGDEPEDGDPFPKDCMITEWGFGRHGISVWRWK